MRSRRDPAPALPDRAGARDTPPAGAGGPGVDPVIALQRAAGNRAVARLVREQSDASARVLARDPAAATAPPANAPQSPISVRDVDRPITETISHAPAAFRQWNGTYSWRSKWRLRLDGTPEDSGLDVIVRLNTTASSDVKASWENAIRSKWSGRFAFAVLRDQPVALPTGGVDRYVELYPIRIVIPWVESAADAHYVLSANAPGANEGGRAGIGGTTSMTGWGTADTTDITHEFGHILGCPEEYFTTNGVNYAAGGGAGFRDPGGGVMNNPAGPALARNFNVIKEEAAQLRGVAAAKTEIVPWR